MANGDFTSSFTLPDWSSSLVVVCILASDWIAVWSPDPSSSNESFGAGSRVLSQDSGIVIPKTESNVAQQKHKKTIHKKLEVDLPYQQFLLSKMREYNS